MAVGEGRRVAVGVHTYGGWERAAGPPRSRRAAPAVGSASAWPSHNGLWGALRLLLPLGPGSRACPVVPPKAGPRRVGARPRRAVATMSCTRRGVAASARRSSGRAAVDRFRTRECGPGASVGRISKKSRTTIIVLCDLVWRGRPHAPWEFGQVRRPRPASHLRCLDVCRL